MKDEDDRGFRLGHAAGADWHSALESALAQALPAPTGANLGFVYASDLLAEDFAAIVATCRARSGVAQWVGTTGLGVCATGREYHDTKAVAVLLGAFPPESFELFSTRRAAPDEAQERSKPEHAQAKEGGFGVLHGDPRDPNLLGCIPAISDLAGGWLIGGLTASRGAFPQAAGTVEDGGLSGVLFDERVPILTGIAQGCEPMGPYHRVDACDEHAVLLLDDRPAYEVFCDEAGPLIARDPRRAAGTIFAGLPVEGSDRTDYVVRNLLGVDPRRGSVAVAAPIETGQRLMFCRRDPQAARGDLARMLSDLARRLGRRTPRGALYFSCVARGERLFGGPSAELAAIAQTIGPVPLVGFFGNGEIARDQLYAYTGVLTLFL
jgi:small ligand-binding sensory domain FIST